MKIAKITGFVILAYIGIVVLFEYMIGYVQPQNEGQTLVLTTTAADGTEHERVLSRIVIEEQLYVAVNHWPRAWYKRVQENPVVGITLDADKSSYRASTVSDPDELQQMQALAAAPLGFRILTGFPPRYFVRLDPME